MPERSGGLTLFFWLSFVYIHFGCSDIPLSRLHRIGTYRRKSGRGGASLILQKAVAILLGSFLVGIGVNWLIVPHKLMDGGMIGIGLLANYYLKLSPGLAMLIVSIPVYGIVFHYNRMLFYHSFHGMLLSSFFIDILSEMRQWSTLPIDIAAILGGTMIGTGIGIMLAYQTNTGGTDLLAQFLSYRTGIPVAVLIFFIDGLIIISSWEAIGTYRMLYSILTILTGAIATHWFSQIGKKRTPYVVVPLRRR